MKPTTRRTAISMALSVPFAFGAEKSTAFALIGDRYHNSDYIRTGLGKTLGKDLGLTIDFRDEVKLLNAETLRGYKLLIIFRDGMTWPDGYPDESSNAAFAHLGNVGIISDPPLPKWGGQPHYWITSAQGKAVREFAEAGGGVLFYHNVTYISPHNDDFRDVLGAVTQQHPPIRPFKVKVINNDHPITRGVKDFVVTDEQHFMRYQKDPKYLLLQSVNEDGLPFRDLGNSSAAGWAYDYGKGRVCYLAPGHLLVVRWLLRQI
jgi:hypothetical protein